MLTFFFQAEVGIRDLYVTGVQTCALPICVGGLALRPGPRAGPEGAPRRARVEDVRCIDGKALGTRAGRHGDALAKADRKSVVKGKSVGCCDSRRDNTINQLHMSSTYDINI